MKAARCFKLTSTLSTALLLGSFGVLIAHADDDDAPKRKVVAFTQSLNACVEPDEAVQAEANAQGTDDLGKEEFWYFSRSIGPDLQKRFIDSIHLGPKGTAPIAEYTEAVALENSGTTSELKALGAFWQGRIFFDRGMITLAYQAFASLAASAPRPDSIGLQAAALECVNRISTRYKGLEFPDRVGGNLPALLQEFKNVAWEGPSQEMLIRTATAYAMTLISRNRPVTEIDPILAMLRGSIPLRQSIVRAFYLVRQADYASAAEEFEKVEAAKVWPIDLKRFEDEIFLTAARVHYKLRNYEKAVVYLKRVPKESNYTVRVLAELSWLHLMRDDFKDTVGVALNLQKGGFRNTFAPESLIVMAMAFNEVCQFPFAFRSVRFFYRKYKKAYEWLKSRYAVTTPGAKPLAATLAVSQKPYPLVVNFVQTDKTTVPLAVMTEWTRSSVFTSLQELINLNLDERKRNRRFRVYQDRQLIASYREVKNKIASTPKNNRAKQAQLRKDRESYQRMAEAAKKFRESQATFDKNFNASFQSQVELINRDLDIRAVSMLQKLRELVERAYLIQVDIYNGASEDIVWRNAHPEYVNFVDKVKKEENSKNADQVWNWGPVRSLTDENDELWEDELDSLKAGVFDNCANKDRYMNILMTAKPEAGGAASSPGAPNPSGGTQSESVESDSGKE